MEPKIKTNYLMEIVAWNIMDEPPTSPKTEQELVSELCGDSFFYLPDEIVLDSDMIHPHRFQLLFPFLSPTCTHPFSFLPFQDVGNDYNDPECRSCA